MNGIILIDKSKGWTSFDVVAKIRGILARYQLSVISNQSKIQMTDDRKQKTPLPKAKKLGVSYLGAVQSQSITRKVLNSLQLDATQGGSEKRNKSYKQYDARVSELPTQRSAKSSSRVGGFADKQAGAVRRIKVGHTGTLDPLATGLLVILVGSYTKKAPELTKLDKTYEVTMKLGATSTTGDSEGVITPTKTHKFGRSSQKIQKRSANIEDGLDVFTGEVESFASAQDKPSRQKLSETIKSFIGEGLQTPPAYSAIKVNGQRAYKLARQGKEVRLEPRKITVYSIQLTDYSYPEVKLTAKVSSGTYIRSLVEDIGKKLDTGAYMSDLKRTKVGNFDLKDAVVVGNFSPEVIHNKLYA